MSNGGLESEEESVLGVKPIALAVRDLYDVPEFADVEFICEGGVSVRANKGFIAARSEYFRNMLYGGMEESSMKSIPMLSTPAHSLRAVLEYIHTDDVSSVHCEVFQLIREESNFSDESKSSECESKSDMSTLFNEHISKTEKLLSNIVDMVDLSRCYRLFHLQKILIDDIAPLLQKSPLRLVPAVVTKALRVQSHEVIQSCVKVLKEYKLCRDSFINFSEEVLSAIISGIGCDKIGNLSVEFIIEWGLHQLNQMKSVQAIDDMKDMTLGEIIRRPLSFVNFEYVTPEFVESVLEKENLISSTALVMAYKKQAKRVHQDNDWMNFKVGQVIDCKDCKGKWYESTILEVEEERIYVHYEGWSSVWDEWVSRSAHDRLAKKNSYTSGPFKRPRYTERHPNFLEYPFQFTSNPIFNPSGQLEEDDEGTISSLDSDDQPPLSF